MKAPRSHGTGAKRWIVPGLLAVAITTCTPTEQRTGTAVVAAASPEAAAAGIAILEAGGNAIDAAVAVSFALAVTEPAMSGLGGQTQILFFRADSQPLAINGTSFAPWSFPNGAQRDQLTGRRVTTVPSTVKMLGFAWSRYGSGNVAWAELLEPAIMYAEEGFVVGPFRHRVWRRHEEELLDDPSARELFLDPDGSVPAEGSLFRQPRLAATLRRLAERGAEDFYSGEIARQIADDMEQNGGWITSDDLAQLPEPRVLTPLRSSFRSWDVHSLPPPGSGWVVLQILNLFEQWAPNELAPNNAARSLRIADALRIGHASHRLSPVRDLIEYEADVAAQLSKDTARLLHQREGGETTHFTVVDTDGSVASVTASINTYFGARAAHPELGFLYHSYMDEFELDEPGHVFARRPGAMPYSSMSPTIVARDGQPVLGLGSPGSARIISAVAQVVQLWIDERMPIADAVAAPRVHVVPDDRLYLEDEAVSDIAADTAAAWGYRIVAVADDVMLNGRNAYFGGVHAVAFREGTWQGAADPRRDGAVRVLRMLNVEF